MTQTLLQRPVAIVLLCLALVGGGIIATSRLGVTALPERNEPRIYVDAGLPGASATVIAHTVIAPVERQLGRVPGVEAMYSSSSIGRGFVQISFSPGESLERAARDVQGAINAALPALPAGMPAPPTLYKLDGSAAPLVFVAVTADGVSRDSLTDVVGQRIVPTLAQVDGVAQVKPIGAPKRTIQAALDPAALAALGLTAGDVGNVLRAQNAVMPVGSIVAGGQPVEIVANDTLRDARDVGRTVVTVRDGVPLRLADIAAVSDGPPSFNDRAWFDGHPAIIVQVGKRPGANDVATVAALRDALDRLRPSLPATVHIDTTFDLARPTGHAMSEGAVTLLFSIACVVLVTFAFLRSLPATVLVASAIPLSLAGTCIALYALGFTLNMLTLLALIVCVGLVIDDAVIVVEDVARRMEHGQSPARAAAATTRALRFTVISMSASLVAVFVPMLFGVIPVFRFLREFTVTLAIAVAVSAIVALCVLPGLAARHMQPGRIHRAPSRGDARFVRPVMRLVDAGIRHARIVALLPLLAVGALGPLYTGVLANAGAAYMPLEHTGLIAVNLGTAANLRPERLFAQAEAAQRIVLADPAVARVTTTVTGSAGAGLFIELRTPATDPVNVVVKRLSDRLSGSPNSSASVSSISFLGGSAQAGGSDIGRAHAVQMLSLDGLDLKPWALRLAAALQATSGFLHVASGLDPSGADIVLRVDRASASRLEISSADVDTAVFEAFGRHAASVIRGEQTDTDVVLSAQGSSDLLPEALLQTYVRAANGRMVPLGAIASLGNAPADVEIVHQDQLQAHAVGYDLAPGVSLTQAETRVREAARRVGLPKGIALRFDGDTRQAGDTTHGGFVLVLAAAASIFVVLGMLYESLLLPFVILSTLPAAGVGALSALLVTHTPFTTMSVVAIVILMGIGKRNAIILVDFARAAERDRGLAPAEAIRDAMRVRLRPIAMTSLVALAAVLPLLPGGMSGFEAHRALAIAIIGGLLVSQPMTLLTVSAVYVTLASLRRARSPRLARAADHPRQRRITHP